jgi:hypothetical protein
VKFLQRADRLVECTVGRFRKALRHEIGNVKGRPERAEAGKSDD